MQMLIDVNTIGVEEFKYEGAGLPAVSFLCTLEMALGTRRMESGKYNLCF